MINSPNFQFLANHEPCHPKPNKKKSSVN